MSRKSRGGGVTALVGSVVNRLPQDMEASLTCAVCLGVFRDPVTLPRCSHNFCKSCVLECASPPQDPRYSAVSCPLCRKVSTLSGGLIALPVNTTLAELVLLLPAGGRGQESPGAEGGRPDTTGKSPCTEHPDYRLELFCRNCERACCGKCVSLRHQGVFHSVNLLDITFQEEKLVFFNSMKTLREIHARLAKEISDDEKNTESALKANGDAVTSAFGEVQKALDLKKQQFLDLVNQQQSAFKKRSEVRKVTKALQKTTVENLLKDCDNILDDHDPKGFLQVSCGLNKRMKSNLELMEYCADHNDDVLRFAPRCVDLQSVLDAISALKMTSGSKDPSKQNGSFSFKSISRTWSDGMETTEKYCPVHGQELIHLQGQMQKMSIRFVCITKMPEYQHLSYEELRLKYYEPSVVQHRESVPASDEQIPIVNNNVNNFTFKMSSVNHVKSTRVKRQDTFDQKHKTYGKDVFKEKPIKTDIGRIEQKDSLSACALEKDNPVKAQGYPSFSIGGLTTKLASNIQVEKTPKLYNEMGNKALFPNFCLGKSEIATIKTSGRNEKCCKKLKSTACFPTVLSAASVPSTSAMADTANIFRNVVDDAEEDMSVDSASSEEFYDASCNVDPDVEKQCAQSSSHNSTDGEESSSLQRSQH